MKCFGINRDKSVFAPFFNEKTLDYLFDNQASVGFAPPQYFAIFHLYLSEKRQNIGFLEGHLEICF